MNNRVADDTHSFFAYTGITAKARYSGAIAMTRTQALAHIYWCINHCTDNQELAQLLGELQMLTEVAQERVRLGDRTTKLAQGFDSTREFELSV